MIEIQELVSVIIPTYNRPLLLEKAIGSVVNQSYTNLEVIVVNDSDDNERVKNIISEFNDNRIKYFANNKTKGANGARNTGILEASANYIAFLDDDDQWFEEKIERQIEIIYKLNTEWGGIFCGARVWSGNKWLYSKNHNEGNIHEDLLFDKINFSATSTLLFRKNVFEKCGYFDEELIRLQDVELMIRISKEYKIASINESLVSVYGHNIDHINTEILAENQNKFHQKVEKFINNLDEIKKQSFLVKHYYRMAKVYASRKKFRKAMIELNKLSKLYLYYRLKIVFIFFKAYFKP